MKRKAHIHRGFTPTNERQGASSLAFSPNAVGAKPQRGFTSTNEKQSVSSLAFSSSVVEAKPQRGFTLIEVLVATAIFVTVVTVAVSALIVVLDASRKAQNMSNTINNAFFSMETMARLMRTGYNYHCRTNASGSADNAQDCPTGGSHIYFTDDRGYFVHIWHDTSASLGVIKQEVDQSGATNGISFGTEYAITSPNFDVESLVFHVSGSEPLSDGDTEQALTTISLDGVTNSGAQEESRLRLQTSVTQRMLDL